MRTECSKCVMDNTAEEIVFDKDGVCNFCHQAQKTLKENKKESINLNKWIEKIKNDGREYDCLMGLSGGVDSSMTLHKLVELGLKPLCFSMDNGYNDPKADENVKKLVKKLKVKHEIIKIDLDKYGDLQAAFLRSGVRNIEIPTDHILMALSYKIAKENNIRWIMSGGNGETESIMPPSWGYNARDLVHIKDIYKKVKGRRLKGLPTCGLIKFNYYRWVKGIKIFYLLDYINYNRLEAEKFLEKEYGFKSTGEKHEENVYTRWFQNFYLYQKFGIDKRKAHYSSLINSGQMTRNDAKEKLKTCPIYPQFGIEDTAMMIGKVSHYNYKTDEKLFNFISKIVKLCRIIGNAVGRRH